MDCSVDEVDKSVHGPANGAIRAFNFRGEAVHLTRTRDTRALRFDCRRCGRNLPQDQFLPLFAESARLLARKKKPYARSHDILALHPWCHVCRDQARGEWVRHPLYTPALDSFITRLMQSQRSGAKARGIGFFLEKDDVLGLFIAQEGRCALTGLQMDYRREGANGRGSKARLRPSIDRINSHGNYSIGNVQMVAAAVNLMKGDLHSDDFVKLCAMVAEHELLKQIG